MNEKKKTLTKAEQLPKYARGYAKVFSVPGTSTVMRKFDYGHVTSGEHFETPDAMAEVFREEVLSFERRLFDLCVRYSWLSAQFGYKERRRKMHVSCGHTLGQTFAYYVRRFVGVETRHWSRLNFFSRIRSYFPDLFPYFELGNPFETPEQYAFPYKYVTLGHMLAVSRLREERMAMLDKAEREKMPYADFLDYVCNYVNSRNDELGRARYGMSVSVYSGPFAFDSDYAFKRKKNG